jgi:hypothetical protein
MMAIVKKKNIVLLFIFFIIFLFSCGKDKIAPEFEMLGDSTYYIPLFGSFNDPGVKVSDNKSDNIVVDTTSNVNFDSIGVYSIKYVAYDEKQNIGVFNRKIYIILTKNHLKGKYTVNETVTSGPDTGNYGPYEITLIADSIEENKIYVSNFGGYGINEKAYFLFDIQGNITIPQQTFAEGYLSGTGKVSYNASSIEVNYEIELSNGKDVANFKGILVN